MYVYYEMYMGRTGVHGSDIGVIVIVKLHEVSVSVTLYLQTKSLNHQPS
jgi:hypothetical protein